MSPTSKSRIRLQGKFTIWYLSDGLLVAALTAGRSDDLDIARSLLLSGVDIGPLRDALTDAGSDLSFLLGSRDGGGSWL